MSKRFYFQALCKTVLCIKTCFPTQVVCFFQCFYFSLVFIAPYLLLFLSSDKDKTYFLEKSWREKMVKTKQAQGAIAKHLLTQTIATNWAMVWQNHSCLYTCIWEQQIKAQKKNKVIPSVIIEAVNLSTVYVKVLWVQRTGLVVSKHEV